MHNLLKVPPTTLLTPTIIITLIYFLLLLKIAKADSKALPIIRHIAIIAIGLATILFMFWIAGKRQQYGS